LLGVAADCEISQEVAQCGRAGWISGAREREGGRLTVRSCQQSA